MLSGSLAFAFVIFATFTATHWECLSSLIVFIQTHLAICVRSTVDKATWLVNGIVIARPYSNISDIYHAIAKALVTKGVESLPGRFVTAVVEWYFPSNKPEKTLLYIAITIIYFQTFHSLVISLVWPCLIVLKHYLRDMTAQHSVNQVDMSKEVRHPEAFAIVAICLFVIASLWFLKTTLVRVLTLQKPHEHSTATPVQTSSISAASPTSPPSKTKRERRATIFKLEDTIRQQRVQLAEQTAALEAANQATDQVRREFARESSTICNALQGWNDRLYGGNWTLRKQLAQKGRKLDVARRRARVFSNEVDTKAEAFVARIQDLEEQLHEKGREAENAIRLKNMVDSNTQTLLITVKQLEEQLRDNERQLDMATDFRNEVEAEANELHITVTKLERRLKTKPRPSSELSRTKLPDSSNTWRRRRGSMSRRLNPIMCSKPGWEPLKNN
jgi:hypothetical protein